MTDEEPGSDDLPALLWAVALCLLPAMEPPATEVPRLLPVVEPPVSAAVEVLLFLVDVPTLMLAPVVSATNDIVAVRVNALGIRGTVSAGSTCSPAASSGSLALDYVGASMC